MQLSSLGEKIKKYRKRAGMSQMDLEVAIESSPGSISRIESGKVNPTKETLNVIIKVLNIPSKAAASLFGVEVDKATTQWLNFAKKLALVQDHKSLLQLAVDEVINIFDVEGASIFRVDETNERLVSTTFTQSWYSKLVWNMIPVRYDSLYLDLKSDQNLLVRSVKDNKVYKSNVFTDFSQPTITYKLSKLLRKLVKFEIGLVIPMNLNGRKIGAILFHRSEKDEFTESEIEELKLFTEYIGSVIYNFDQFDTLKMKLGKF